MSVEKLAGNEGVKSAEEPREFAVEKREQTSPFFSLRNRMEKLFDDFSERFPLKESFGSLMPSWSKGMPALEVSETEEKLEVSAEIPGMDKDNVEVMIDDDSLLIKGEKKEEKEEKKKDYFVSERSYGSFERRIPLPKGLDQDALKAKLKKGVLKITIPKVPSEKQEAQKIEISGD